MLQECQLLLTDLILVRSSICMCFGAIRKLCPELDHIFAFQVLHQQESITTCRKLAFQGVLCELSRYHVCEDPTSISSSLKDGQSEE